MSLCAKGRRLRLRETPSTSEVAQQKSLSTDMINEERGRVHLVHVNYSADCLP